MYNYQKINPSKENRYSFRLGAIDSDYENWATVADCARIFPIPGMLEKRGGGLIDLNKKDLECKIRQYMDPSIDLSQAAIVNPALAQMRADYEPRTARINLLRQGFRKKLIRSYLLFAFDIRFAYTTDVPSVWNRVRPPLLHTLIDSDGFLITRAQAIAEPEGFPTYFSKNLGDDYIIHKHAFFLPVVENLSGSPRPNLSDPAAAWLEALGFPRDAASARLAWHHVLAITYSPEYLTENAGGIRQGWPRIPLPDSADTLRASAALGAQLAALLDPETPVPGVTTGTIRPELRAIAVPVRPQDSGADWSLSAWGNRTDKGITMPGRGRVESRPYTQAEAATAAHAALLGPTTNDIFLNPRAHWRNIPDNVWECRIGGYQVLKKWLSYRDSSIIKRPLTPDEVAHIQNTARRLAAILLLGLELDASYRACAASHRPLA
jgi:hypothetical protein